MSPRDRAGESRDDTGLPPVVLTMGHSTRSLDEFLALLVAHGGDLEEIISGTCRQVHALTPFARVDGLVLTYALRAPGAPTTGRQGGSGWNSV